MMHLSLELLIIASLASLVCALPGTLLVLRGAALMSDAISHAVLLGIALMFLVVQCLDSWLLLLGAALSGLGAVLVVEKIITSQKLKKDAALGLTFPLFFSLGVIIISCYAKNAHLDTDMVLLGELAFAPFSRFFIHGIDCGPSAMWVLSITALINCCIVTFLYKEWHLILFDQQQAALLGYSTSILHYLLMSITSISAVATFNIVGSLVVVALMIIPAATAYLCAQDFKHMLFLSMGFGIASAWGGYALAIILNSSIAGCIAVTAGLLFGLTLIFEPTHGILSNAITRYRTRHQQARTILDAFLGQSDNKLLTISEIAQKIGWSQSYIRYLLKTKQ